MGQMNDLRCPKCGYRTHLRLGVGFLYPEVFAEAQEKGKRGDFGEDIKEFFEEYPNGVIDPVPVIMRCEKCGNYTSVDALTMYIPDETKVRKKKSRGAWSIAMSYYDADYVAPGEFKEYYKVYKKYPHTCKKCNGKLKSPSNFDMKKLECPRCKHKYLEEWMIAFWD